MMIQLFSTLILALVLAFLVVFLFYSFIENEKHAIRRIIPLLLFLLLLFVFSLIGAFPAFFHWFLVLLSAIILCLIVFPFGNKKLVYKIPKKKFDERDIMFSRNELKEGTPKYNHYYSAHPEKLNKDNLFRKEAGLLHPNSKFYDLLQFNAANSTFSAVDLLQVLVDGKSNLSNVVVNRDKTGIFLKNWIQKLGAHSAGFTKLQDYHMYSTAGRGENYGKKVKLDHKYAIAFTVEMEHEFVQSAPKGSIIMESAQQYLNAGQIAVQVAQFIRNLGFSARAHIDANYQVICPIVAQDAGLGTIGRMGLLMTPTLGPRIRIGVVTTDMPLNIRKLPIDSTVLQFCELCKKCASNCPSQSISYGTTKNQEKWKRWKINHEKCFTYWNKVGTDCGKCIAVCPYSHPNNFIHNCIRWAIRRNGLNRSLALRLDNYFYGEKPFSKPMKSWLMPDNDQG